MEQLLIRVYHFFNKKRLLFLIMIIASFLLVGYFALQVRFEEDISKILPKDKKIEKLNEIFQNSKFIDKLVVTVSLKDTSLAPAPDSLVAYAGTFVEKVQSKLTPYISKINDRVDDDLAMGLFNSVSEHLPLYLDDQDYKKIDSLITPAVIKETLEQDFRTLTSPAGLALKTMISNDPVGISFLGLKKLQQLQYDENFDLYDSYVVTRDKKHLLLFITPAFAPSNTAKNERLINGLDQIIDDLQNNDFKNLDATYFGATAVSLGNALQLRRDSILTGAITVLFIILFIGFYFRKKRAPFLILVPVLFGVLFALAGIYFVKGSISVIAFATGSIIMGIAVNYSLHVFNHYRHTNNIEQVIRDLAIPMTVGSFTTIGGFLCLEFVESEMLKDLGLFAAFSLIGASLASLIFLPHLIVSNKKQSAQLVRINSFLDRLASYRPEYNKYLVGLIFLLTIFFAFFAPKVSFESDLNKMNYMSGKLHESEKRLNKINEYALQSVYLVTEGKTLNEALLNNEQLQKDIQSLQAKNIVKKYSGVSSLIFSDSLQKARIEKWNQYWTTDKKSSLIETLNREGAALKFSVSAFKNFSSLLNREFEPADPGAMAYIRKNFLDDYITEKPGKTTVVTLVKVIPEYKQAVYKTFEDRKHVTVLDKQYLAGKFVDIIQSDFMRISLMTSILVFVVLLIMYGRIELTLISFVPMAISWVWILGIMALTGIQFNIINIIISALIFGLGDDYSLFIMDGLLQEYKTGKKNLSSFKSSILLSAITTIAGLGVLIFAQHPALKSIAFISIIGILSVVIMSQILIPFFFNLLIKNRTDKKLVPWTFVNFNLSAFAFSIFISFSVFFASVGRLFVGLRVKEKGKLIYHTLLSKACWMLMHIMFNVKKRIINPLKEDFSRPAIIICNHQSSLDIVPLIALHPKILMLTNNRKWNARFFGPVIRMADYFPAEEVELYIDKIADRMKHGYSLIIFPEGTRSEDGVMGRFHKGAFYLAEKLNADILPIMIHGTNYTLKKKDTLLKNGKVTLKFLPRIKYDDAQFGNGYVERTKKISRYYKNEFEILRADTEQTSYFRDKLIYNYLYKGPFVEWYTRIKTRIENNYQVFHELSPREGKILDIGCGYGYLSYMLQFTSSKRQITGIDYDEEKIATANHCFSKTDTTNFHCTDILDFNFERYDAIILADMLHYLEVEQQEELLEKCINQLDPGGVIIIREGDTDDEAKHKRTRMTEYISTKLIKFNKTGKKGLSFISGSEIARIASSKGLQYRMIRDSKYTSNSIFVLSKAKEA